MLLDTIDVYGMFDGQYAAANVTGKPYPITDAVAASNSFKVQLFGQIIAAISQPMLLNAPPRIANDWFPKGERDLAMHLMTQSNNIGGGFGSIIPAYQVRDMTHLLPLFPLHNHLHVFHRCFRVVLCRSCCSIKPSRAVLS